MIFYFLDSSHRNFQSRSFKLDLIQIYNGTGY